MKICSSLLVLGVVALTVAARAGLQVPAFTAYVEPDAGNAAISDGRGIVSWNNPAQNTLWFGGIKTPSKLDCTIALRLPAGAKTKCPITGKAPTDLQLPRLPE